MQDYSLMPWLHDPWQLPREPWQQLPGVISEDGAVPGMTAESMGAPLPSSGEFAIGSDAPQSATPPPSAPMPPQENVLVDGLPASQPLPDYMAGIDRALADNQAIAAQRHWDKPKFNFGNFLMNWAGFLGDELTKNPAFANSLKDKSQMQRLEKEMLLRWQLEQEAERRKRLSPRPEQVGSTLGVFDPSSLRFQEVFRDPSEPERYAIAQGLKPGTDEFIAAMREYRAGTWGPQGVQGRLTVQQPRLEQSNTNNIRSTSTSRENNIRSNQTTRRGQNMTDSRVRRGQDLRGTGLKRGDLIGPVYQRGSKRVQYSKSKGGYVDLATGQRVD